MIRRAVLTVLLATTAASGWGGEAAYRIEGERPAEVVSNGFVQTVVGASNGGWHVSVTTDQGPIGAVHRLESAGLSEQLLLVPDGFQLPAAIESRISGESDPWVRATVVLEWVDETLRLDTDDRSAQDAASVLRRGSGRCSGLANAGVGLLRAAGVPARTISGVLVGPERTVAHRWLECHLPGAGWVPSDPTLGLWAVTARHVAYRGPLGGVPEVRVLRVRGEGVVDRPKRRGRSHRPNRGASLRCRLADSTATAWAVLDGPDDDRRFAILSPEASFRSLSPGRWRISVVAGNRVVRRFGVWLREGDLHSVTVPPLTRGAGS